MKTILLVFWMFLTFILTLSVVGWFVLASDEYNHKSTWMEIGIELLNQTNNVKK